VLVPSLPAFHARYPDIQLDMGVSDRVVDLIDNNVDCVVRGGELTDLSLMARHIGDLQLGIYASPDYLARAGVPQHPQELNTPGHHVVAFLWARTAKALSLTMRNRDERVTIQGRYILSVDDGNAYLAAGLAGLGALWLPDYMSREHVATGQLIPLLQEWELDPMPMYVAYPPNRHVSAKLRVFIDWVAQLMAAHAPVAQRKRQ
ncbi:MAG: LysR substrate-binding domain-containing protein, partial [Advenella sp.]